MSELYNTALFDREYYGSGARGGFGPEINWDNPEQQKQLSMKWELLSSYQYRSVLFVGCGPGAEVRYFTERGKDAMGVEVSEWAVEHCLDGVKDRIRIFDGENLPGSWAGKFDVTASFDVLPLIPVPKLMRLGSAIQAVTRHAIVFRAGMKSWHNRNREVDGEDGVKFRLPEFYDLDQAFSGSAANGFKLGSAEIGSTYQGIFRFHRKS